MNSASLRLACFGVHGILKKLSLAGMVCVVLVFCAGAAITSPAQVLTTLVNFDLTNGESPRGACHPRHRRQPLWDNLLRRNPARWLRDGLQSHAKRNAD